MSAAAAAISFNGRDLELELLDPHSQPLVRLFRHAGGHWDPPPADRRTLRVDPPASHQGAYAVLYTGSTLPTIAIECRVLWADDRDRYSWLSERARQYQVVRYDFDKPALFIPIDLGNARVLGLEGDQRDFGTYGDYQRVGLTLYQRYGAVAHGLSWTSFHRNQPGRVYALWHDHKSTIGLSPIKVPGGYPKLIDDTEWNAFVDAHPQIERLDPAPPTPK